MFSRLKTLSVRLLCCFQRTSHLTEKKCDSWILWYEPHLEIDKSVNRFLVVQRFGRKIQQESFLFSKTKNFIAICRRACWFYYLFVESPFYHQLLCCFEISLFWRFLISHMWFPMFFRGFSCRKMCFGLFGRGGRTTERNKRITEYLGRDIGSKRKMTRVWYKIFTIMLNRSKDVQITWLWCSIW